MKIGDVNLKFRHSHFTQFSGLDRAMENDYYTLELCDDSEKDDYDPGNYRYEEHDIDLSHLSSIWVLTDKKGNVHGIQLLCAFGRSRNDGEVEVSMNDIMESPDD